MENSTNLALVLLAAFWAGTNAVFSGIKETNAVRDQIISGKIGERPLTKDDRWHAFWWDWAPMKLSLCFISAVLCIVILELPNLRGGYKTDSGFGTVCIVAALMPALGSIYQLISFVADAFFLRNIISASAPTNHT